jgi:hypothetical protein
MDIMANDISSSTAVNPFFVFPILSPLSAGGGNLNQRTATSMPVIDKSFLYNNIIHLYLYRLYIIEKKPNIIMIKTYDY